MDGAQGKGGEIMRCPNCRILLNSGKCPKCGYVRRTKNLAGRRR